jgi:hypothetical protein
LIAFDPEIVQISQSRQWLDIDDLIAVEVESGQIPKFGIGFLTVFGTSFF